MQTTMYQHKISFGDCDPAGIVYYPNIFRWMDASFHHLLSTYGGHAKVCKKLNAVGLGLINASCDFKSPLQDGDHLEIELIFDNWSNKTYNIKYVGKVGNRIAFEGTEVRALFQVAEKGIETGEVGVFKDLVSKV